MLLLRWLLMILGVCLLGSAAALVAYDIYLSSQLRRLVGRRLTPKHGALRENRKPIRLRLQRAA